MPEPTKQKFSDFLKSYGNGSLDDELTRALAEVSSAVHLLDKDGTVSLTLKLSEKGGGIVVSPSVKAAPPIAKNNQFFYINADGMLQRRDPNQPEIPGLPAHISQDNT